MADLLGETVYKANTLHKEVQSHGFRWEKDIIVNVYGALIDELANIMRENMSQIELFAPAKEPQLEQ